MILLRGFAFSCLFSAGHGRRMQSHSERVQGKTHRGEVLLQDQMTEAEFMQALRPDRMSNCMQVLVSSFLAREPAEAYHVFGIYSRFAGLQSQVSGRRSLGQRRTGLRDISMKKIKKRKKPTEESSGQKKKKSAGGGFAAKKVVEMEPFDSFKYTGSMRPGIQSPKRKVPDHILKPSYAKSGVPPDEPFLGWDKLQVDKTPEDIAGMRAAGRLAREVLDTAGRAAKVGVTTDEIDRVAHEFAVSHGAYPSPLNYHGFPKSICTSVNEVICHGIPDSYELRDGDIMNIDVTVYYKGYHGDCSEMFLIGNVDEKGKKLVKDTHDAWKKAIDTCKPGMNYKDIGRIIEDYVSELGYESVQQFCGHGIGKIFHCKPNVFGVRNHEPGKLEVGHTFTIEPMICEGTQKSVMWNDDWTAATRDGGRSAQFEHTFLVTEDGVEALTARLPDSQKFFWEVEDEDDEEQEQEHESENENEENADVMTWGTL